MMVAARFRVASRSVLSAGMARIRTARDHEGGTIGPCARSLGDMYLHSSAAVTQLSNYNFDRQFSDTPEVDDEHHRSALASPLLTQKRGARADLTQI